ncbi:MAG: PilN domain-containing protein [Gammaproteobacteria bacterium]|nr:PilN domain-containing protein [Gammaproteobacteria bacterium]MBP9729380.1 PilN domain-containing protein [Gammaproteobacteria bacterium]
MSNINLLPWREDLRQVKNKNFLTILIITLVVSGSLILCADLWLGYKIKVLAMNAGYMDESLKVVSRQITQIQNLKQDKKELLNRMKIIRSLEFDRVSVVKLLDAMPRVISNSIYFTEIDRSEIKTDNSSQTDDANKGILENLSTMVGNTNENTSSDFSINLDKKQYLVIVKGIATNNNAISAFLKSLSDLQWVSEVQLNQVKEANKDSLQHGSGFEFTVQFVQNLYEDQG